GLGFLLLLLFFSRSINYKKINVISLRDWLILFVMGSLGYGLAVIFVTLGALHTKLLNVAIIGSTTPFFVFLFSIIVLQKRLKAKLSFFLILSFYGVCVLATKSLVPAFSHFGIGELDVLLYAIGIGMYVLGRKFLSKQLNNSEIAAIVMAFAFLTAFVCAMIAGEKVDIRSFDNSTALEGLFLGGILNVIAVTLQNFGYQHLNAVVASQLLLLENVFAPILGFVFYQEHILPVELLGALIVLIGVWAFNRYVQD
ncbi:MAG: DMT family transporter, partial [Candidatus Levyibacteriota bacterium]